MGNGYFVFSVDSFPYEVEVHDSFGGHGKLEADDLLAKAKEVAKAKAREAFEKVLAQIDEQTFEDTYDCDEPEYNY